MPCRSTWIDGAGCYVAPIGDGGSSSDADGIRDWSELLDGFPRRLKRGKHFVGEPKPVARAAREAAAAFGKTAVVSQDASGKWFYLWVQFVDGEVERGKPCPVCGATQMEKAQKRFVRCPSCGSTLKAVGGWDVEAGLFGPPDAAAVEEALEEANAEGTDSGEDGPDEEPDRARELAEILGGRILSADGLEIESASVYQDFFIEVSVRFLEPVDTAYPRLRLAVGGSPVAISLAPGHLIRPSAPETVDARVRVPAGLLVPRGYTAGLEVILWETPDRASHVRLLNTKLLEIPVVPTEIHGLPSPLDWEITARDEEPADGRPMP